MSKYCLKENKITDERLFNNRRLIIKSSLLFPFITYSSLLSSDPKNELPFKKDLKYSTNEQTNTFKANYFL